MASRANSHKCLLSEIVTKRTIAGASVCKPGEPAVLPPEKVKLHYVVHYLHRGSFDKWIADVTEEEKAVIDMYICNICNRKFRNNLAKKEYPARGSIVCHLATEHGKILDVMREDKEVDMQPAIDVIVKADANIKKFYQTGTETKHGDNLVKTIKASQAMINSISRVVNPTPITRPPSPPKKNSPVKSNLFNFSPSSMPMRTAAGKGSFKCPKCTTFKETGERSALRFHLIEHYAYVWEKVVPELSPEAREHSCTGCRKRVTGSTARGLRNAVVVHWALQHGQLAEELRKDPDVDNELIARLEATDTNPSISSRYSQDSLKQMDKNYDANKASNRKRSPEKKNSSKRSNNNEGMSSRSTTEDEDSMTPSGSSSSDSEAEEAPPVRYKPGPASKKRNNNSKGVSKSGDMNSTYVKKRAKITWTLESDGEDSDEWSSSKKDAERKKNKRKTTSSLSKRKRGGGSSSEDEGGDSASSAARRATPRRAAAKAAKFIYDEDDEEAIENEGL